jgi:hypothetical protein
MAGGERREEVPTRRTLLKIPLTGLALALVPRPRRGTKFYAKAVALGCLAVGVVAPAQSALAAHSPPPPPSTLTGESLVGTPGAVTIASSNCDPSGTSTFTFDASGTSGPPYAGTFTEHGTVAVGPQNVPNPPFLPLGTVTALDTQFNIDSPAGQVAGTKHLITGFSGLCASSTPPFGGPVTLRSAGGTMSYEAVITTADGRFRDRGQVSNTSVVHTDPTNAGDNVFSEGLFNSDLTATEPLCDKFKDKPGTDKDKCKEKKDKNKP